MAIVQGGEIVVKAILDDQVSTGMSSLGKTIGKAIVGMGLTAAGVSVIRLGASFESAFAGVRKTVDATEAEFSEMRSEIRGMAKEMPTAANEIAGVAEAAGQLGIKNDAITSFTRTMVQLGDSTNMSATDAATALARLANITGMPQENFDRLGSTVVALGNNLATTEQEIVDMGLRLAGAGKQVGMSESTILSLAGALSSVGIEAEAGGSAFSKVMVEMQLAAEQGGDSLQSFADVAGMSAEEFAQAYKQDAAGALMAFIEGLSTCEDRGVSAISTLDAMGISEVRMRDALLRAAGASDVFSEALSIGSKAWDENAALTKEAEQRYQTFESKLGMVKNAMVDLGISIYDSAEKPLKRGADAALEYANSLSSAFEAGGVKGLASELGNVFDDLADRIGSTSTAANGVITPLRNITSAGMTFAKTVLPVMGSGLGLVARNMDALIPLVVGGATAIKAYTSVQKATLAVTKANAAATKVLAAMEKANALQLMAANGGLTARQAILAVHNGQITVTTALTGLWAKAQTALNAAISANPIGAAVVAMAAFLAVGTAIEKVVTRQSEEELKHSRALRESAKAADENLQKARERKQAYEDFVQTQNEQAAGDLAQIDRLSSLNTELQSIVDANGQVIAGEENRAAFIVSQLSSALGIEISMTGNQINNYQALQEELKKSLEQKKIDAVMTAQQAKYEEAVANQMRVAAEASASLTAVKQAENDVTREKAELASLENERNQAVLDGNKGLVKVLEKKIEKQMEDVSSAEKALDKRQKAYQKDKELLQQYANDIDTYTALAEAAATGNADAINAAITQITAGIKTASNATKEELQQQVVDLSNTEAMIQQEIKNQTPGFKEAMLTKAREGTTAALEEFAKAAPQTAEELSKVSPAAVAALLAGDMKGQLSAEAKGSVEGMLDQFDGMDAETQEAFAEVIHGALQGLEGFEKLKDPAKDGTEAFLESLREALQVHSPSRAAKDIFSNVWPGAVEGLSEGESSLTEKGLSVVQNFLAGLQSGIGGGEGATGGAAGIGSALMSQFGAGVSSQTENSRLAGASNATAASEGAGSVDPTTVGGQFGSLFGGGINGMGTVLNAAGVSVATLARTGAASVKTDATGRAFGQMFSRAVGDMHAVANASAKVVANAANGGLGSVSTYSVGTNFVQGFISGVGSLAGAAAQAAANVGRNALDAIKAALGIHSPSKEMEYVGDMSILGLLRRLYAGKAKVLEAGKGIASALLSGVDVSAMSDRLQYAVDAENTRISRAIAATAKIQWDLPERGKEPKTIQQVNNFYDKVKSPVETAREIKKAGREMLFGYR